MHGTSMRPIERGVGKRGSAWWRYAGSAHKRYTPAPSGTSLRKPTTAPRNAIDKIASEVIRSDMGPMAAHQKLQAHWESNSALRKSHKSFDDFQSAIDHRVSDKLAFEKDKKHGGFKDQDVAVFKKTGVSDPIRVERMRGMIHDWMVHSHDTHGGSRLRVGAAARHTQNIDEMVRVAKRGVKDERHVWGAVIRHKDAAEDVSALMKMSQEGLPKKLKLYRGVSHEQAAQLMDGLSRGKTADLRTDAVTSFTLDPKQAKRFGPVIISTTVPREHVIAHYKVIAKMGFHDSNVAEMANREKEFIVQTTGKVSVGRNDMQTEWGD